MLPDATVETSATGWPARWSLSKILDRGLRRRLPVTGTCDVIGWAITGHVFSATAWAPAPVCWVGDFGTDPPLGVTRIDPVHLAAGPRGLTLVPPQELQLTTEEARRLTAALADSLGQQAMGVRMAAPDRWYLCLAGTPGSRWWMPEDVAGRSLLECLPGGDEGAELGRLLNEMQVVLHQQPDNIARRDLGRPEVNSVWPWGWASRPLPRAGSVVGQVRADDPYALGLAALAGVATGDPGSVTADVTGAGFIMPGPRQAEDPRWLEERCGRPLVRALARRRITAVRVITQSGRLFELSCRDRRKFWRRSRRAAA